MALGFLSFLISISFMSRAFAVFPQGNLYRDLKRQIVFGNFRLDQHHKLISTKVASSFVKDIFDCTFSCISEPMCKSFNIEASPNSNSLHLCELLDSDKHRASGNEFQASSDFHHYSPWVSLKLTVNQVNLIF